MRLIAALCSATIAIAACADAGTSPVTSDHGIAIELAALNTSSVTYAQYTVTVKNATPLTIATVQIDSDTYKVGTDPSLVRYVAPCDAALNPNTVTVSVDALTVGGTAVPTSALPADQTQSVVCVANSDVPVAFDFFAVASSQLGFFDVVLGTDVITCSAKLDCQTDTGFFPSASGVVLGFSCTMPASTSTDPVLHMDKITVACTTNTPGSVTVDADVAGNISVGDTSKVTASPFSIVNSVTVFRGEDTIGSTTNTYWNVALGIDPGVLDETCTLTTKATVTDGDSVPIDLPYIDWDVQLTTVSGTALTCTDHPLFGESPNDGVTSAWPTSGTAASFDNLYTGNPTAFVTSGTYTPGTAYNGSNAFFASVADANAICTAAAGGLSGASWVAWLSDTAVTTPVDAADQVSIEQLRLVDGTVVALGKSDLLDGTLAVAINKDEAGLTVSGEPVWTGTSSDGTSSGSDCNDWTDGTISFSGTVGVQSATATWTDNGTQLCNVPGHLICIQVP